jgi:hypothetical protein
MPAILAAAIGETMTSVALFGAGGELHLLRSATVANEDFTAPRPLLRRFLAQDLASLAGACLSVAAGAPWRLTAEDLGAALGLPAVDLIDEATAAAEWLFTLPAGDLIPLAATGAAPAPAAHGLWAACDDGAAPALARLHRIAATGHLTAAPCAPLAAPAAERPAAAGSGGPGGRGTAGGGEVAALLARLAAQVPAAGDGEASAGCLYAGGAVIRGLSTAEIGDLDAALAPAAVPIYLVRRAPQPLWGAARRAWRPPHRPPGAVAPAARARPAEAAVE